MPPIGALAAPAPSRQTLAGGAMALGTQGRPHVVVLRSPSIILFRVLEESVALPCPPRVCRLPGNCLCSAPGLASGHPKSRAGADTGLRSCEDEVSHQVRTEHGAALVRAWVAPARWVWGCRRAPGLNRETPWGLWGAWLVASEAGPGRTLADGHLSRVLLQPKGLRAAFDPQ